MSTRKTILKTIRGRLPEAVELPDLTARTWHQYDDPVQQFLQALESVGGIGRSVTSVEDAIGQMQEETPFFKDGTRVCSTIEGIPSRGEPVSSASDPHTLEDLDLTIARGAFGVAENGAIWVTGESVPHKAILFIPQHLVLFVPASSLAHNMHEAYDRITFDENGFGVFISGPSKTADIEQSLVIGAHGARSLTVFLE